MAYSQRVSSQRCTSYQQCQSISRLVPQLIKQTSIRELKRHDWPSVAFALYQMPKEDTDILAAWYFSGSKYKRNIQYVSRIELAEQWLSRHILNKCNPTMSQLASDMADVERYESAKKVKQLFPVSKIEPNYSHLLISNSLTQDNDAELLSILRQVDFCDQDGMIIVFGGFLGIPLTELPKRITIEQLIQILFKSKIRSHTPVTWNDIAIALKKVGENVLVELIISEYSDTSASDERIRAGQRKCLELMSSNSKGRFVKCDDSERDKKMPWKQKVLNWSCSQDTEEVERTLKLQNETRKVGLATNTRREYVNHSTNLSQSSHHQTVKQSTTRSYSAHPTGPKNLPQRGNHENSNTSGSRTQQDGFAIEMQERRHKKTSEGVVGVRQRQKRGTPNPMVAERTNHLSQQLVSQSRSKAIISQHLSPRSHHQVLPKPVQPEHQYYQAHPASPKNNYFLSQGISHDSLTGPKHQSHHRMQSQMQVKVHERETEATRELADVHQQRRNVLHPMVMQRSDFTSQQSVPQPGAKVTNYSHSQEYLDVPEKKNTARYPNFQYDPGDYNNFSQENPEHSYQPPFLSDVVASQPVSSFEGIHHHTQTQKLSSKTQPLIHRWEVTQPPELNPENSIPNPQQKKLPEAQALERPSNRSGRSLWKSNDRTSRSKYTVAGKTNSPKKHWWDIFRFSSRKTYRFNV